MATAGYWAAKPSLVLHGKVVTVPTVANQVGASPAAEKKAIVESIPSVSSTQRHVNAEAKMAYMKVQKCSYDENKSFVQRRFIRICEELATVPYAKVQYATCSAQREQSEENLARLEKDLDACPKGNPEVTARDYFEQARDLAKQGDADAQICYLQSNFLFGSKNLTFSDDDRAEYRRDSAGYIHDAFNRGDWRIVPLLGTTRFTEGSGNLWLIAKGDPFTAYKMNRLLRLGADGGYATQLDEFAQAAYLSPGLSSQPPLTAKQVADANAQAQNLFQEYFKQSPLLSAVPPGCYASK